MLLLLLLLLTELKEIQEATRYTLRSRALWKINWFTRQTDLSFKKLIKMIPVTVWAYRSSYISESAFV